MKCVVCSKDFDEFEGYIRATDNDQKIEKLDDVYDLETESICTQECFKKHLEKFGKERYSYSEVHFCPGARECAELDNLRELCSRSERIKLKESSAFASISESIALLGREKWCEPGIAGIIKTNVKLHQSNLDVIESIKNFDRTSTILSGIMVVLTIVILIATVLMYVK